MAPLSKWMKAMIAKTRHDYLIALLALIVLAALSANAKAQGSFGQGQKLNPPGRRDPDRGPNRDRVTRNNQLTDDDRRDLRLIPQGVAQPRILIRVFRELSLSDAQRTKLADLSRKSGNQMPMLNRLRKAQSDLLDEALYGEKFDPATIEKRAADLAGTQSEIIKHQARIMAEIRQILTPEQSARFRDLLTKERESILKEQMENRPPPPEQ